MTRVNARHAYLAVGCLRSMDKGGSKPASAGKSDDIVGYLVDWFLASRTRSEPFGVGYDVDIAHAGDRGE
jgi:hypothetical protein